MITVGRFPDRRDYTGKNPFWDRSGAKSRRQVIDITADPNRVPYTAEQGFKSAD
jgi:hypothetical protein